MTRRGMLPALAAILVLAGCQVSAADPPSTASQQPAAEAVATPGTPTTSVVTDALTRPGASVKVGEPATLVYDDAPERPTVRVTVTSIREGSQADLTNVQIDDPELAQSTPYYVTMTVTNLSGPAVANPAFSVGLRARNGAGGSVPSVLVIGSIDVCPAETPASLDLGATVTECKIFMASGGRTVASVEWSGDTRARAVRWTS